MKRTLIVLSTIICACGFAWGQGTVNFANANPQVNAPIRYMTAIWGGTIELCSGPHWVADLAFGPVGTTEWWRLTPLHQPATFLTGAQAGYFTGGARTIPGIPAGTTTVLQVRVWNLQAGATWEQAVNGPFIGYPVGMSSLINVTLTGPPYTPANLVGLQSFTLHLIPEPTAAALLVVGGLVFAWRRQVEKRHLARGGRQRSSIND